MFKRREDPIKKALDAEIINLFELMDNMTAYDEEYDKMAASVSRLYELRSKDRISMETWATVGTNLAGIFMLMNHERAHVIATKAFSLVKKIV
jgi:hypothetical protein